MRHLTALVADFIPSFPASLCLPLLTCPILRTLHQVHLAFSSKWRHYQSHGPFSLLTPPSPHALPTSPAPPHAPHPAHAPPTRPTTVHSQMNTWSAFISQKEWWGCLRVSPKRLVRARSGPHDGRQGPHTSKVDRPPWKEAVRDSGPERGLKPAQPGTGMCGHRAYRRLPSHQRSKVREGSDSQDD